MGDAPGPSAIGLTVRDSAAGGTLVYVPGDRVASTTAVSARLAEGDVVLADGTFFRHDDLVSLGLGDARLLGDGPRAADRRGGTLDALAALDARVALVHINNTNPILLEDSPERREVEGRGLVISYDGMEIDL